MLLDITAERDAEAMLHRSERRYRALVEQVPAAVYEMGPDDERRTLFVSPHVEEILGYTRQEWLDQPDIWVELLHPDDREQELDAHDRHNRDRRVVAARVPVDRERRARGVGPRPGRARDRRRGCAMARRDARHLRRRGRLEELLRSANDELEVRVLTRTSELEDANEMMSLEIGERRRIEGELRQTQDRFRALVEHIPGVVYTWRVPGPDGTARTPLGTYTSPRIEDLLGFTIAEWQTDGSSWERRLHPHDRDPGCWPPPNARRAPARSFNEEFRYLAKDGRVVWVLERATLLTT